MQTWTCVFLGILLYLLLKFDIGHWKIKFEEAQFKKYFSVAKAALELSVHLFIHLSVCLCVILIPKPPNSPLSITLQVPSQPLTPSRIISHTDTITHTTPTMKIRGLHFHTFDIFFMDFISITDKWSMMTINGDHILI